MMTKRELPEFDEQSDEREYEVLREEIERDYIIQEAMASALNRLYESLERS